jgi:hypothetical protein
MTTYSPRTRRTPGWYGHTAADIWTRPTRYHPCARGIMVHRGVWGHSQTERDPSRRGSAERVVRHGVSQIRKAITDFDSSPLNPAAA